MLLPLLCMSVYAPTLSNSEGTRLGAQSAAPSVQADMPPSTVRVLPVQ